MKRVPSATSAVPDATGSLLQSVRFGRAVDAPDPRAWPTSAATGAQKAGTRTQLLTQVCRRD